MSLLSRILCAGVVAIAVQVAFAADTPGPAPPPGPNAAAPLNREELCEHNEPFVVHHGAINRILTDKERMQMRSYASVMNTCMPIWKRRCEAENNGSVPGLRELCTAWSDAVAAQLDNIASFAWQQITKVQYNARSQEIENIRRSTTGALLKIAQGHVDELERAAKERDATAERREEAQREEEIIALLRQQNARRAVTTNCIRSADGGFTQCQSY